MNDKSIECKYALYPWFEEHGVDLIDPLDIERFKALKPYGKVFEVGTQKGDMIEIHYGTDHFTVKQSLLQYVNPPKFKWGDHVRTAKNGKVGVISEVQWHHADKTAFFYLSIGAKKDSNRYWDVDLQLMS